MASGTYKLSAQLHGHEDDVRSVAFPSPNWVVSASRDATVRLWKRNASAEAISFLDHINSTGSAFINSLAVLPPTEKHPNGLIVSGGQDTIIEVREPESKNTDADYLLLGHAHNVCTLDAYKNIIVSGSWDCTARVWKNWETEYVLKGHEGSVWAVLVLSETDIVTGSADKTIRLWRNGKQVKLLNGHTDVVRGLCRLPNGGFASCSNDATLRIWSPEGQQLQELHGHSSYVYSIAALPTGELVSCGEDRTLRVWKDGECIQTITHPAISVWSVAVCAESGDIVSGASDKIVRVFSRDESRRASEETIKAFDDSVKASSIPSNQVGDIKKDNLPGPEALEKPGKFEGQAIAILNGQKVEAYVWSASNGVWTNVGTVVDAVGSDRKKMFEGKEYDFVFDVDFQEGAPPLKLPFNVSENPFEAARKFLENNELPLSYLDTVGNFIVQNSKGMTLGQPERAASDPFGIENRYRPGEPPSCPPKPQQQAKPKRVPQKVYLTITQANFSVIRNKINENNQELVQNGEKEWSLNPEELSSLDSLCGFLESTSGPNYKPSSKISPVVDNGLKLLFKIIANWPAQQRLPGLDLLRCLAAATPRTATYEPNAGTSVADVLENSGAFDKETVNNAMLATRTFANLFHTEEGRKYMDERFEKVFEIVKAAAVGTTNRNLKVAQVTLLVNYAVLFYTKNSLERGITLLDYLISIVSTEVDSETTFRALVALGTLLALKGEVKEAAQGVYDTRKAVGEAVGKVKEPRIKDLAGEIYAML